MLEYVIVKNLSVFRISPFFCTFKRGKSGKYFSWELTKTYKADCENNRCFLHFACICVRFGVQLDANRGMVFVYYDFV